MDFLSKATQINQDIDQLNKYSEELRKFTIRKQTSVLNSEDENNLDLQINAINVNFESLAGKIKNRIEENQKENERMKKAGENPELLNMRETHTLGHSKNLAKSLRNFQNVQCEYSNREKKRLKDTYLIACPDAKDSDLDNLMDSEKGEAVLESAFALGSHSAKNILNEAKNRKKKIKKIVETISQLVILIDEIDKLVSQNTHVVDKILINMTDAEENTRQANAELDSALQYEIGAQRIKRILFILAGIIGFVLFLWLFGGFFKGASTTIINNNTGG